MKAVAFALLLVLPGCSLFEMRGGPEKQAETITQGAAPVAVPTVPAQPVVPGVSKGEVQAELDSAVKKISTESQASNNATQNTITGLGLNVTKLAEKLQGFGGDLAHVEANVNTKFEALAKLQIDMKNELTASISSVIDTRLDVKLDAKLTANAQLQAQVTAQALTQLRTDIKSEIEAQIKAQVQAGIGNKMDSLAQEVKAGRDSYIDNTKVANQWVYIILALCGVIVGVVALFAYLITRLQVQRADRAEKHAEKAMDIHADVVVRALEGRSHA